MEHSPPPFLSPVRLRPCLGLGTRVEDSSCARARRRGSQIFLPKNPVRTSSSLYQRGSTSSAKTLATSRTCIRTKSFVSQVVQDANLIIDPFEWLVLFGSIPHQRPHPASPPCICSGWFGLWSEWRESHRHIDQRRYVRLNVANVLLALCLR